MNTKEKTKVLIILIFLILGIAIFVVGMKNCNSSENSSAPVDNNVPKTEIAKPVVAQKATSDYTNCQNDGLEMPKVEPDDQIVKHSAYTLSYSEPHEQAEWVAYVLTKSHIQKNVDRTDKFMSDYSVTTGSASDNDYKKSGYDRGHLAPAADMAWDAQAMKESFYYSNMSPQLPGFNRGVWKRLEELVRDWAYQYDTLFVTTGPVLSDNLPVIGANEVAVPQYYYKVILRRSPAGFQSIGFILPNEKSSSALSSFAVSVDSVERLTHIDFFTSLPDDIEEQIEKQYCSTCWHRN